MRGSSSGAVRALLVALGAVTPVAAGPDFVRLTPAEIHWVELPGSHGVQTATLYGDPDRPGPYVIRVRFPPHVMDRPHWHPKDRYVTVLQGTWYAGTGTTFDVSVAKPMPAGSFMMHPAGAAHWDGSATAEAVIVQITGEGPGTTTQADPSKPMWVEVPR
ncbi:MAG TPA: cupin domain-containing protein [Steroidobacteraceae bacterium]|nr:cupin domain-containing protein [Steroidobacteraceae bacterium]